MSKPSRFDYVAFDDASNKCQAAFKAKFQEVEKLLTDLGGSNTARALEAIEIAYMWCGKAIRDQQRHHKP